MNDAWIIESHRIFPVVKLCLCLYIHIYVQLINGSRHHYIYLWVIMIVSLILLSMLIDDCSSFPSNRLSIRVGSILVFVFGIWFIFMFFWLFHKLNSFICVAVVFVFEFVCYLYRKCVEKKKLIRSLENPCNNSRFCLLRHSNGVCVCVRFINEHTIAW